jgi:general secretion pathway protein G
VLAAFFLDRALTSLESAERMAMENQARAISSALQLQMAALITSRREQEIPKLARANPVSWLISKPENYLGEFERAPTGDDALGHWYFDTGRRELVYLVRRGDRFAADQSGRKEVRYHVREVYSEGTSVRHSFAGLVFAPVSSYRWP